ncbi:MAG: ABC transporter ATP-binding protein [Xanthomonadales bacterium]|nr:ABC transporter ATP-binding protein [Xanthomonadales bacterium]
MTALLVEARGISKRYPLVSQRDARLRALASLLLRRPGGPVHEVLKPMDLQIHRGESTGIIGANGAGKSTLLKLLTGVLTPSTGSVRVDGSIGALLELGAGFHPEYSGRDNLRMAAALAGLSPDAIRELLPGIVEFADIGDYVDEPVKHYSSGMVVRLGFAIVAALKPDLLITDEVLAVGDESFQKKCIAWMERYLGDGGTLLLVSHGMYHVQKLCSRALWLHQGRVEAAGDAFTVTQAYLAWHERQGRKGAQVALADGALAEYRITAWRIDGEADVEHLLIDGEQREVGVEVELASVDDRPPVLLVGVAQAAGLPVYGISSEMAGAAAERLGPGRYRHSLVLDLKALLPGEYLLRLHPMDPEGLRLFGTREIQVLVRGATREMGTVRLPHRWSS